MVKRITSYEAKENVEAATVAAMYIEDQADKLLEKIIVRDGYKEKIEAVAQARLKVARSQAEQMAWRKVLHYLGRMTKLEDEIADLASELGEEGQLIQARLKRLRGQ